MTSLRGSAAGCFLLVALGVSGPPARAATVQIRDTQYGISHIKAAGFAEAGYGLGYAFASENLCIGVELALTLAGERSANFGEDATYFDAHVGATPVRNLESDFYFKFIYDDPAAASMREQLSADARALVSGYVRGFNRFLSQTPAGKRPSPCRGANWLRPLTEADIYRRINQVSRLESTHQYLAAIAGATPPLQQETAQQRSASTIAVGMPVVERGGSNMIAFGRRATANGRGMSFSNPHFPWLGAQRIYAAHLTISGQYDVFGGMLYGTPFIALGFNRDLAWSITYSTNHRYALYRLDLAPGLPTRYLVDGKAHDLERVDVNVPALTASGNRVVRTRSMYRTDYGPVVHSNVLPWTAEHAFVLKDANRRLGRWPDQFLAAGRARNVHELKDASARIRGYMFSNVTGADRSGEVLYGNFSPSINMPDALLSRCFAEGGEQVLRNYYVVLLDGSRSACAFARDGDSVDPEILPASRAPWLIRNDYVLNSNDSHWLVNADLNSRLEGFDRVVGNERTALGDRTRTGLRMVERRLKGADGLPGNRMSLESLRALFYRAETVTGEAIRDDVVRDCREHPQELLKEQGVNVSLGRACEALSSWDGTAQPTSRGAALAREFIFRLPREARSAGFALVPNLWKVPFNPQSPLDTPTGLVVSSVTRHALADAVWSLDSAQIPWDGPLSDSQFLTLNGERVPTGGFPFSFHLFYATLQPGKGYTDPVMIGDSYMHAVTFDDTGPVADVMVTYSQSTDPLSRHNQDMTLAFTRQNWIRLPFLDDDIAKDPSYRLVELQTD